VHDYPYIARFGERTGAVKQLVMEGIKDPEVVAILRWLLRRKCSTCCKQAPGSVLTARRECLLAEADPAGATDCPLPKTPASGRGS